MALSPTCLYFVDCTAGKASLVSLGKIVGSTRRGDLGSSPIELVGRSCCPWLQSTPSLDTIHCPETHVVQLARDVKAQELDVEC